VAMSATFIEHRREIHAMQLAQEQGLLPVPSQWAMSGLQEVFEGWGDFTGEARAKAGVYLRGMMLEEAAIAAYQDFFLVSAFISLFSILPGLLRKTARKSRHNLFKKAS
jgi:hypothetical protein